MSKNKRTSLRAGVAVVLLLMTVLATITPNFALAGGNPPIKKIGMNDGSVPPVK